LGEREQAEQPDQVGGVRQVDRRQEARVDQGDGGADHQDKQEEAEILLEHRASQLIRLPTASCRTFCSLKRSRSRNPPIAPSHITAILSLTPITSSMSLEIIRMATPLSASARISS